MMTNAIATHFINGNYMRDCLFGIAKNGWSVLIECTDVSVQMSLYLSVFIP
jgi:hypothetical protein